MALEQSQVEEILKTKVEIITRIDKLAELYAETARRNCYTALKTGDPEHLKIAQQSVAINESWQNARSSLTDMLNQEFAGLLKRIKQ